MMTMVSSGQIEIAPYHVLVVPVNTKDEASAAKAEEIYMQLKK